MSNDVPAWDKLMDQLEAVQLHSDSEPDTPIWLLENFGTYTTKSTYRFLSYGGGVYKPKNEKTLGFPVATEA